MVYQDHYYIGAPRGPILLHKEQIEAQADKLVAQLREDYHEGLLEISVFSDHLSIETDRSLPVHLVLMSLYEYLEGYLDLLTISRQYEEEYWRVRGHP